MISNAAISYVRAKASENMSSTCRIERVTKPTFNQGTGVATPGTKTTIYEGKCRIYEVTGGAPVVIAEDDITMQATQLSSPWDVSVLPVRNDEVQILTSRTDAHLVGKRFVIDSSAKAGELRATRRFAVRGVQH
jgi:hypothetical protein